MSNAFFLATKKLVSQHALSCTYSSNTVGTYDPATSKVTRASTDYTLNMYPKHITATAYNYPSLIGKQIIEFYLVNESLAFVPKVGDIITFNSVKYTVTSFRSFTANKEIILYKLLSVAS